LHGPLSRTKSGLALNASRAQMIFGEVDPGFGTG
jgi:hypothetical protein